MERTDLREPRRTSGWHPHPPAWPLGRRSADHDLQRRTGTGSFVRGPGCQPRPDLRKHVTVQVRPPPRVGAKSSQNLSAAGQRDGISPGTTTVPVAEVARIGWGSSLAAPGASAVAALGDDVCRERHLAGPAPDPGDLAGDLEDVAGAHGSEELHVGVRREQALVAVGDDAHLGRHVAEQPEAVRPVHEVAGVVGVGVRDVAAVDHARPDLRTVGRACRDHQDAFWVVGRVVGRVSRCTRKLATSPGVVPRPKTRSTPSSPAMASSKRGPPTTSRGRVAEGVGLAERSRHLAGVEQVGVALGDDLGDEHGVGLLRAGPVHELRDGDLGAEVHDLDLAVVLQALLPREPLDVEDRVDAHRVRVGADAGADHDQSAAHRSLDGRRWPPWASAAGSPARRRPPC